MTVPLPMQLKIALEADEAQQLNEIIQEQREDHFDALRKLALGGSGIPKAYRTRALYALGRWGNPTVIPQIAEVLPELDEAGRIAGIDALGYLGTKRALDALVGYRNDGSPQVRKTVVQALSRIGGPDARTKLRAIARQDKEEWVRELAAKQVNKD